MNPYTALHTPLAGIRGRRVLTPSGLAEAALSFDADGLLSSGEGGGAWLDAGDLLVLPGIVDLHGDAFERAIMPRPRVSFPYDNALYDVDRQLLAQGITTEFHGVTLSWEGGLRGAAYAERMFDALARVRAQLGSRHCVHLRFET
ncbi:alpha-D-ribose 1-methylphosphonate 5-triphosphate diphosphatase, partial [Bordetella hinzii]|nr:alpha-D-ribose 1-methylphosphonate 5-triphosphate diphosphatase [Bordetella hinzii]